MCEVSVRHEIEEMAVDDGGGYSLDGERRAVAHARGAAGKIMAKGVDLNAGGLVLNRGEHVGFEFDGSVHAGVVVTVNHHDFFGNEWSYDVLVDGDDGPMTYKNMTMECDRLFPLDGVTGRVVWMAWMIRHDAGGSADADDTGCTGGLVDEDGTRGLAVRWTREWAVVWSA